MDPVDSWDAHQYQTEAGPSRLPLEESPASRPTSPSSAHVTPESQSQSQSQSHDDEQRSASRSEPFFSGGNETVEDRTAQQPTSIDSIPHEQPLRPPYAASRPDASPEPGGQAESNDSEGVCRICRCGPEVDQPLFHPCKCTGSIRFCHQDCLKEWLTHSRKAKCELCNHVFAFHKVYSNRMPSKLPVWLRASFMVRRLANWFFTAIRCAFVVAVWLGFVPWVNLSFLRFSLWLVDVLVWTTIGSTSTWTGAAQSSAGFLNATMPSASLPAAPSPPFQPPGQDRSSIQELVGSGSGGSADSAIHLLLMVPVDFLLSFCSQMVPRQVTYIIELALSLYLIGIPSPSMQDAGSSLGSRRTASRRTGGDAESMRTFFRFMAHDVFLGQLLTCGITIAVLAVWFTREWVVMQMPVQVPDAEGQPGAEEDVGEAEPEAAAAGVDADTDPEAPMQAPPVAQRERHPSHEEADNRASINLNESSDDVDELELASLLNPSELRAARIARFDADSSSSSSSRAAPNANAFALQFEKDQPDEDWWSRDFDPLINGYGNGASRIVGDDREGDALRSGSNKIDGIDDDDNEEAQGESGRRQDILQPTGSPESRLAQVRSSNPEHATDLRNGSMTRNGSDETESKRLGSDLDARANTDRTTQQSSDDGDIPQPVVGEGGSNVEGADSRDNRSEADESAGNEGNESGDNEATASEGGADDDGIVIAVAGGNDDDDDEDEDDVNSDDSDAAQRPPAMGLLPPPNENEIRDALVQALERQQDLAEMPVGAGQEGEEWGAEVDVELAAMVEAIGFRGDPMNLLANVSIIIALGFAFVLLLVALPFGLGRTLGLGRGIVDVALAPVRLLRMATDPAIDWFIDAITRKSLHLRSSSLHRPSSNSYEAMTTLLSPTGLASRFQTSSMKHASTPSPFTSVYSTLVMGTLTYLATPFARIETILVRPSHTTLEVIICVAIGHGWWMAMLSLRLLADKYAASRQRHVYRQWWLPELVTQALIVAKVLAFLAIEIVVFPVGCGLVLDACTLPLFGASPSSRLADVTARPLSWVFIRWAIGTMWMYRFGLYVSHVRGALRPGVLSWIRDPEDPDFQPIKEILERKSGTQLRKIGASAVMYASLIVLLVGANVWTLRLVLPATSSLLPLRIQATLQDDQALQGTSSLDLLAILFILPLLTDRLDPEGIASKFSQRWWRFAAHHSGLSEYLLGSEATKSTTASRGQQASTNDGVLPHNESFLARIPASDNSVIGSPLLIRLDDDTEEPVTDRGKEALRIQKERIEKMKEPKAKYINMRLQNDFGRRMFLVLASLWMSMSVGLQSAAVPLLLGRWLSSGRWHDVHAFVLGCVVIAPVGLAMYALAQTPAVQKRLQSRAWGGSSLHKRSRRRGPTFGRLRAKIQRRAKRWMGVAWLSFALGAVTPTLLGIAVDQSLISLVRFEATDRTQTSLLYAWTLGLLLQALFVELTAFGSIVSESFSLNVALQDMLRRGWKRCKPWQTTKTLVLPVALSSLVVIIFPILLSSIAERSEWVTKDASRGNLGASKSGGGDRSRETAALLSVAGRLTTTLLVGVFANARLLAQRMPALEREMRDENYLEASELKNYNGGDRPVQPET